MTTEQQDLLNTAKVAFPISLVSTIAAVQYAKKKKKSKLAYGVGAWVLGGFVGRVIATGLKKNNIELL